MKHEYNITGMTCTGCISSVKQKLSAVPGIMEAEISLTAPQAAITMNKHIPTAVLQEALGNGKYTITDAQTTMPSAVDTETKKDSYYPIFLIFGYIAGITLLIQLAGGGFHLMHWMGHFMAGFFIVFSFFKMLRLQAFADGYRTYDIVARAIPGYAYVYPFIELALGISYIMDLAPLATNIATLVIMGVSTIGVVQSLAKKKAIRCACLGTIIDLPLSKVTLFEDLLMVVMSAIMLVLAL
ncbi:hypothetical protein GCM10023093_05430 [Nemorincola caseinilytica]|uniref:HMA domain-containing protein n=1 Tax=Nemorincola caseinilytica TaxID=2054315 RepID=A0ABP8N805_9BACT